MNKNSLQNRRAVFENLIEKPPFQYAKSIPSENGSIAQNDNDNIVNINLTSNHLGVTPLQSDITFPNSHCKTTINLFINDPNTSMTPNNVIPSNLSRNKTKNNIVLGKNIPNHAIMKSLLNNFEMEKKSSTPSIDNLNYLKSRTEQLISRKSCRKKCISSKQNMLEETDFPKTNKEMTLLYVNDKKCKRGYDVKDEGHNEYEHEEVEPVREGVVDCAAHFFGHSVVQVNPSNSISDRSKAINIDQFKRTRSLKKNYSWVPSTNDNSSILYRDSSHAQDLQRGKLEQPRRTVPPFQSRTQLVKKKLNYSAPESISTYQSRLASNNSKIFENLRRRNFEEHLSSNSMSKEMTYDDLQFEPEKEFDEKFSMPILNKKIDDFVKQSSRILNRNIQNPVCSIESHGSYQEYKKNLVRKPDGTLCCKDSNENEDDTSWSKAETRKYISSEFIKGKLRRFDRFAASRRQKEKSFEYKIEEDDLKNTIESFNNRNKNFRNREFNEFQNEDTYSTFPLTEEPIKFPKETKNAMSRLLDEQARLKLKYNRLNKEFPSTFAILDNNSDTNSKPDTGSILDEHLFKPFTSRTKKVREKYEENMKKNKEKITYWPGVAERVWPLPEENMS